jgi:hypothetical protein
VSLNCQRVSGNEVDERVWNLETDYSNLLSKLDTTHPNLLADCFRICLFAKLLLGFGRTEY